MKKLLILIAILLYASSAFAAATTNTAGSTLKLDDAAATTPHPIEIAASPKVNMSYLNADATNFQYFIIGTYHQGGDNLYATSSSVTKVYHYKWATDDTKDFTKLPTTQSNAQSEVNWLTTLGFSD